MQRQCPSCQADIGVVYALPGQPFCCPKCGSPIAATLESSDADAKPSDPEAGWPPTRAITPPMRGDRAWMLAGFWLLIPIGCLIVAFLTLLGPGRGTNEQPKPKQPLPPFGDAERWEKATQLRDELQRQMRSGEDNRPPMAKPAPIRSYN